MSKPFFSIVVPVYNVKKYIERCLESIIDQNFTDYECFLIDDGSTDGSSEICDEYAKRNKKIKVIHQENKGSSIARNRGLDEIQGQWLLFIDADDWIEKNMFDLLHKYIISNDIDIITFNYVSEFSRKSQKEYQIEFNYGQQGCRFLCNGFLESYLWTKAVKIDLIKANNISFSTKFAFWEDFAFSFMCFYYSKQVLNVRDHLYHYNRVNENSMVRNMTEKSYNDIMESCKEVEFFLINQGVDGDFNVELSTLKMRIKAIIYATCPIHRLRFYRNLYSEVCKNLSSIQNVRLYYKLLIFLDSHNFYFLSLIIIIIVRFVKKIK